jgi:hypothetical protein
MKMKPALRMLGFAFLAWLLPFVAALCLQPVKRASPRLFESLMGVVLTTCVAVLFAIESRSVHANRVAHAGKVAAAWIIANWLLDGCMFSAGPMKMTLAHYMSNIGLAYLMIIPITVGMGAATELACRVRSETTGMTETKRTGVF